MTSTNENILKTKILIFCIRMLFTQCNTGSCCGHITGGVIVSSYVHVIALVSVCLSVFVVSNESQCKNHVICVKPAVNSKPCCIKQTTRLITH